MRYPHALLTTLLTLTALPALANQPQPGHLETVTPKELAATCNESHANMQLCHRYQEFARLVGISSLSKYINFAQLMNSDRFSEHNLLGLPNISDTPIFQDIALYTSQGADVPEHLQEALKIELDSRTQKIGELFEIPKGEVFHVIERYTMLERFYSSQLEAANYDNFVLNEDDDERPEVDEVITVTARQAAGWSSSTAIFMGATSAIQQAGIVHQSIRPLRVMIEISDAAVPTYRTFDYSETMGAVPRENTWQECQSCPIAIVPF